MKAGFILLTALIALVLFSEGSAQQNVTVSFTGMTPHVNQGLYLRVIDKSTLKETGRVQMTVSSAAFNVTLPAVEAGGSYFVDFFADLNNNNVYDAPPTDHAWRLELNNAAGDDTLTFAHNIGFTDINWEYLLTLNFTNMTPHVGQLLEIKLENSSVEKEITRVKIPAIDAADFSVKLPGLKEAGDYSIEFYADLNGSGLYNEPPVDHAWKLSLDYDGAGDEVMNFSHNTSFSDVKWNYLVTVNLNGMIPHLGQKLELRVVSSDGQEEAGRISRTIDVANMKVFVPGIDLNKSYHIDFYADHNNSGTYDAPPVDHAWRLEFTSPGDFTANFGHNTNFIDIQWPAVTSVGNDEGTPLSFQLSQNYPNPFNPATSISFQVPADSKVLLKVYDVIGNEIATLINEERTAGTYNLTWNAASLPSGVYFYKLTAGANEMTRKMVLLK